MRYPISVYIISALLFGAILLVFFVPTAAAQNQAPYADAGRDFTVAVGVTGNFHGIGVDDDGRIDLYEWDFEGDGTYDWSDLDHGDATWTYQEVDVYYAMLRVTDNDAATDTDVVRVEVVTGNEPPTADPGPDLKWWAKDLVHFEGKGNDSDGHIMEYRWDFDGDGTWDHTSDDDGIHDYMYTIPDTYYPVFMVIDDGVIPANDTESIKVVIYEENKPPIVSAGLDMTAHAKESVRFEGTAKDSDGKIIKYEWDFDSDGDVDWSSKNAGTTFWSYDSPGKYTAKLTVTDNHELPRRSEDSIQITVLAENKPPTSLAGEDISIKEGELAQFKGKGTDDDGNVVQFRWDFDNDGIIDWISNQNGNTYNYYETPGEYTARLEVKDDVGAYANSTLIVNVEEVKTVTKEEPLLAFNLSFIIALIIGIAVGAGIGVGATYAYLHASIARKYQKIKQLETGNGDGTRAGAPGLDDESSFRGTQVGEREPPAYRGGDELQ